MENEEKIEKCLNFDKPIIYLDKDAFGLEITKEKIRITCGWDYGFAGRGSECIDISTNLLKVLIMEILM